MVEDEEVVRKLARQALEQYGYHLLETCDGGEALQLIEQYEGPIHLLPSDRVMPGMSGRELAEKLTGLYPTLKVLYMSGYTDNAIVHHGVLEPGIVFLQKPFRPGAIVKKVREVLDAPR